MDRRASKFKLLMTAWRRTKPPLPKAMIFPFLELPAEIRNQIYQYCLSGEPHQLCFSLDCTRVTGITTSLLTVNKQIYTETSSILYSGSLTISVSSRKAIPTRDDGQVTRRSRGLRSRKSAPTVDFTRRMYPHVVARFRRLVLSMNLLCLLGKVSRELTVQNALLKAQLKVVLKAIKHSMLPGFTGPRVQELSITLNNREPLLRVLHAWGSADRFAQFDARQSALLEPFLRLTGALNVEIEGVYDADYVAKLRLIVEADGDMESAGARQALDLLAYYGP